MLKIFYNLTQWEQIKFDKSNEKQPELKKNKVAEYHIEQLKAKLAKYRTQLL